MMTSFKNLNGLPGMVVYGGNSNPFERMRQEDHVYGQPVLPRELKVSLSFITRLCLPFPPKKGII
jgi:hypothetical protein